MAEEFPQTPIVLLENDYPERIGKLGLFDIQLPVGNTGLRFVAAMPGILYPEPPGVQFSDAVEHAARLRAATTLIQMGLVRGESFAFIRAAIPLTTSEVAAIYGVSDATVQGWEDNSIPIPVNVWECLSYRVCLLDGVQLPSVRGLCGASWRPRVIRVFPNLPIVSQPQISPNADTCPPLAFPGSSCYPPTDC